MIQARGQICSNSSAHLLSNTLRSKVPSGPEREILWRADMRSLYQPICGAARYYRHFNAF